MTTRATLYTAIDVGTTKVVTLVAGISPNGGLEVLAVGYSPSFGMRKGLIANFSEVRSSIGRSIADAKSALGGPLPPAFVGVTGAHLTCANLASTITREDGEGKVTDSDVARLLKTSSEENHPDPERRIVHIIPRAYHVDDERGVRNPVGLTGRRLATEAHVVRGDSTELDNIARAVREAGVPVRGMVLEHLASVESVLTAGERAMGVVLVDSGGGTTDVAIFTEGTVCYTVAIPVAGQHFTNDLTLMLGLTPEQAENTKLLYAAASADGMQVGVTAIPPAVGRALRERADELARLILLHVRDAGFSQVPPGGVVLTGGTSKLPGFAQSIEEHGSCAVRLGAPATIPGIPDAMRDGSYSTAVGLLLWGIRHQHTGAVAPDTAAPATESKRKWFRRSGSADRSKAHV